MNDSRYCLTQTPLFPSIGNSARIGRGLLKSPAAIIRACHNCSPLSGSNHPPSTSYRASQPARDKKGARVAQDSSITTYLMPRVARIVGSELARSVIAVEHRRRRHEHGEDTLQGIRHCEASTACDQLHPFAFLNPHLRYRELFSQTGLVQGSATIRTSQSKG